MAVCLSFWQLSLHALDTVLPGLAVSQPGNSTLFNCKRFEKQADSECNRVRASSVWQRFLNLGPDCSASEGSDACEPVRRPDGPIRIYRCDRSGKNLTAVNESD
ncbi:hypothetical protein [Neorhodopirellula lusitana]|uniref:hypothetical protein n=1 Tax=Neorhodopirellula lusitana TaxID=445327 RepID=UPI0024B799AE|nr:hypothetical protein [Neorhodopirellula lusitana]